MGRGEGEGGEEKHVWGEQRKEGRRRNLERQGKAGNGDRI